VFAIHPFTALIASQVSRSLISFSLDDMARRQRSRFKAGDRVRVIRVPPGLDDKAVIGTPRVFGAALGKTFRVQEISEHGLLELHLRESGREAKRLGDGAHIIWIEPEFVQKVRENAKRII
jgi:hypothetical protein